MPETLKYSLIVFLGGSCYGVVIPFVSLAHSQGFSNSQILIVQYAAAVLVMGIVVALFSRRKVGARQVLKMMATGIVAAGVSFTYYRALEGLPAATALTLLFQFVWIGVLVQIAAERKAPPVPTVLAMLVVLIGTYFAAGIFDEGIGELNLIFVAFGLGSAICYSAYLYLLGRVETGLPSFNRSFFMSLGSLITVLLINPWGTPQGELTPDILPVAIPLGIFGILLPVFLLALGSPHLSNGLTSIMASSELPAGIVCAGLFAGSVITPAVALGAALILGGIVLSQLDDIKRLRKRRE